MFDAMKVDTIMTYVGKVSDEMSCHAVMVPEESTQFHQIGKQVVSVMYIIAMAGSVIHLQSDCNNYSWGKKGA